METGALTQSRTFPTKMFWLEVRTAGDDGEV